jgi:hypothetical protein
MPLPTSAADLSSPAFPPDLDAELAAIPEMSWPELCERWTALTGLPVPRIKQGLLRLALAWELQASRYGGVPRRTEQYLERLGSPGKDKAPSSLKLVREWRGVLHTVEVDAEQRVHWNGQQWRSLSEVARAITGTRWSGPAFFGVKQKGKAA